MGTTESASNPAMSQLIEELESALGEDLMSVVLYGSAARGDYEEATSDLNVIVVCRDLGPPTLDRLAAPFHQWSRHGHPSPRLLSPSLIADAADVFPIEFLDLRDGRRVLYGADPFASLEVHTQHLRHQCERELREKLMRLREGYIEGHGAPKQLRALLIDSFGSFVALFRGCLHLAGEAIPVHNDEVVSAFCVVAGVDRTPFTRVDELRGTRHVPDDIGPLFASYYEALTRAVDRVDRFDDPVDGRSGADVPQAF